MVLPIMTASSSLMSISLPRIRIKHLLLGTWRGSGVENWQPGKSTMLQVLLLIQGLILNAEPYYNEPGYESSKASYHGRQQSKNYSENTFLLSL
ncbi:putative ubiquitin-conjugating enzyme E2 25 [Bienertia sinuspersici]